MAHARRYFFEAKNNDPLRAEHALKVFKSLYTIEQEVKEADPKDRLKARQERSKPIWQDFGKWLTENIVNLNEKSAIYKAFAYTMARFKRLGVYLDCEKLNYTDQNQLDRLLPHNWLKNQNIQKITLFRELIDIAV